MLPRNARGPDDPLPRLPFRASGTTMRAIATMNRTAEDGNSAPAAALNSRSSEMP
jgi:hypothetical protein